MWLRLSVYTLPRIYNKCLCQTAALGRDKQQQLEKWDLAVSSPLNKSWIYTTAQGPCFHPPPVCELWSHLSKHTCSCVIYGLRSSLVVLRVISQLKLSPCFSRRPTGSLVTAASQIKKRPPVSTPHKSCPTHMGSNNCTVHCTHDKHTSVNAHMHTSTTPTSFFLNSTNGCFKKLISLCG